MRAPCNLLTLVMLAFYVPLLAQTMSTSVVSPQAAPSYTGKSGEYIASQFRFGTGETLPALRLREPEESAD